MQFIFLCRKWIVLLNKKEQKSNNIIEVIYMSDINRESKLEERLQREEADAIFNSVTRSKKVVNQNQTHNARKEGLGPNTKR